jgi:Peptidase family M23
MIRSVVNLFRRWVEGKPRLSSEGPVDSFVYDLPFLPGQRYSVVQGYGGTYSHTGEDHFSIDFDMPEGTPVCAARAGVVCHVTDHFSEGGPHPSFKPKANMVCVLHNDDTVAACIHLAYRSACVRPGDFVSSGTVIGFSGNTGFSAGPHLHFHVTDAFDLRRTPTWFNTVEKGVAILERGGAYTKPGADSLGRAQTSGSRAPASAERPGQERYVAAYRPQLLELSRNLNCELTAAGYDLMSDYSSVEALHDVYGLEVCGVRSPDVALDIVRLLLRRFPGWNAAWFGPPDGSAAQEWVVQVQRDRDPLPEYWDID